MSDFGNSSDPYGFRDLPPALMTQPQGIDPSQRDAAIAAMMGEYNTGSQAGMAGVLDVLNNRANGVEPSLRRYGDDLWSQLMASRPNGTGAQFDGRPVEGGNNQQQLAYLAMFAPERLTPQQLQQYQQAAGVFDNYARDWQGLTQGATFYQSNALADGSNSAGAFQRGIANRNGAISDDGHTFTGNRGFMPDIADYWNATNGNVGSWYQMPGNVPSEWNQTAVSNPITPSYDPSFGGLGGLGGYPGATPNPNYDPYNPMGGPGMLQNQPGFQLGGPGLALADTHMQPLTWGTPGYGGDATPNYMNGTGGISPSTMRGVTPFGGSGPVGEITVNPLPSFVPSFSFSSGF